MIKEPMQITPLGDSALILHLRDELDEPEQALREVLATIEILRGAALAEIIELAPAYTSIGIFFDPTRVALASDDDSPTALLITKIAALLSRRKSAPNRKRIASRTIEIPVCYAAEFAPDLGAIVQQTKLPETEIVRRHSSAAYCVQCVGFTPGFPYLSGLPPELATPRRATPRKKVPTGSVAIGGAQTGIYPQVSPGGWNIIGRTPVRLFDPERKSPAMLRAGDRVRFRVILRDEFETLSHAAPDEV